MTKEIQQYLSSIKKRYSTGISTEHTYRADLQSLLENIVPKILVTNEPTRVECGAPDYIIQRKEIPIGYIEAKDIGVDLKKTEKSEQLKRYKASLDNLILTDYLEFRFYRYGEKVNEIKIAETVNGKLRSFNNNFDHFVTLVTDFCSFRGQTIKSSNQLAKMMAQKARMMEEIIFNAVSDENEDNTLKDQFAAFKKILIHDLDEKKFADIYAQTIAYGLFAARLNDRTLEDFSREEALFLVPKSNPFLRQLFTYVAGPDLDDRVVWIVNDLADIFQAIDLKELLADFGKSTQQTDPFMHFYETFLAEYDPKLRKSRGVYYTPEPVVNFIVRAVDDILKTEFNLPQGLADTSKVKVQAGKGKKKTSEEFHKVQILDPATGTGTFLAEVIKQIYSKFEGQQGAWNNYVKEHLIPRLNGFEILMASYTMAHLKLDMLLKETGYEHKGDERFRVFLTNSLEEAHPDTGTLFASWLSNEAAEANYIKQDTPVMVIVGNPPYSGESVNKGEWIMSLMEDYKKEPGGKEKLKERNPKAINDDYAKFLRYGQYFIEKNGDGVLAFINPHGFIDNPTYRGMRWNLLKTYDKIYTIDLHGNSKKKETCPDGSADVNVFDIMQGVSINIFVKTGQKNKSELSKVFHHELFGKRNSKYEFLWENGLVTIPFKSVLMKKPMFYFVPKDFELENEYQKGFAVIELMPFKTSGVKTHDDRTLVADSLKSLEKKTFAKYGTYDSNKSLIYSYRPFDNGYIYYDTELLGRARKKTIYHLKQDNIGLILVLQPQAANLNYFDCAYLTNCLTDTNMYRRGGPSTFPLYLYPAKFTEGIFTEKDRKPNLNTEIVGQIANKLVLEFTNEKEGTENTFAPIDILDYIYAVLHSPTYRKKYKEFLMIDFPRIPYPKDAETLWRFVKLGGELRQIHLLEAPVVEHFITTFPEDGDGIVGKIKFDDNKVWINDTQYFGHVSQVAWEFYIGGYQPAQKWLKDRKGRELKFEDIQHYQKIIVALTETDRIMREIDEVGIE